MSDGSRFFGHNRVVHRRRGDIPGCTYLKPQTYEVFHKGQRTLVPMFSMDSDRAHQIVADNAAHYSRQTRKFINGEIDFREWMATV